MSKACPPATATTRLCPWGLVCVSSTRGRSRVANILAVGSNGLECPWLVNTKRTYLLLIPAIITAPSQASAHPLSDLSIFPQENASSGRLYRSRAEAGCLRPRWPHLTRPYSLEQRSTCAVPFEIQYLPCHDASTLCLFRHQLRKHKTYVQTFFRLKFWSISESGK